MLARSWRWLAPVLVLAPLLCVGCDLASVLYFLVPEGKLPPDLPIADPNKKKEVKAMVLVLAEGLEMRPDFLGSDRHLAELLIKNLKDKYQANEDKVVLLSARKVEDFKNDNPDWKALGPLRMGQKLGVDYVIVLEMNSFSLYEKGAQMYQGRTSITVSLVKVNQGDAPPDQKEFDCEYPRVANVEVSDMPVMQFRSKFLATVAQRLSLYFATFSPDERRDAQALRD